MNLFEQAYHDAVVARFAAVDRAHKAAEAMRAIPKRVWSPDQGWRMSPARVQALAEVAKAYEDTELASTAVDQAWQDLVRVAPEPKLARA